MYNQNVSIDDFLNEALKTATLFLSSKKSLTLEDIIDNPLLQKAICQTIVTYWKNPKAQENFLSLLGMVPQDIFIEMLSSIGEMFKDNPDLLSLEDKQEWCHRAAFYLEEKNGDIADPEAIEDGQEFLFLLINGNDIDDISFINNNDDEDDDYKEEEEEEEEDYIESQHKEVRKDQDILFLNDEEDEDENENDDNEIIDEEDFIVAESQEKINMNPTLLATSVLLGVYPNNATQLYMLKNKSFGKAFVNALSLQTVINELQNVKKIQEKFIKGIAGLDDDIFEYAWQILFNRRSELLQDWPESNKKEWLNYIEQQQYPGEKKYKIIEILKLKTEKINPYSKISKYYYENGNFADDAFDEKIDETQMLLYAQALAKDAVSVWKSEQHDTLTLFAEAIKYLEAKPFEMAVQTLVETFDYHQKSLNLEDKKTISFTILEKIGEANASVYEDYREILINAITGYNKMVSTQDKAEEKS